MSAERAARDVPAGTSWAFTEHRTIEEVDAQVRALPMALVYPDPTQPRKVFGDEELRNLAASIREKGLQQPIGTRPDGAGKFVIIWGERRWRAHQHNKAKTILSIVKQRMSAHDVFVAQIIENLQRQNLSPLEEADAYQRLVNDCGGDVERAAKEIGLSQSWRITERTCLLKLLPEYRQLFASGNLGNSQAFEMAQLSPAGQKTLFEAIKRGQCPTYAALRAVALALREKEAQGSMFAAPPEPTPEEKEAVRQLERRIDAAVKILSAGFDDGEVVAAKKVDPNKAATYADKLALIRKHLLQMEQALRAATVTQARLL